jgi:hypothetical protein
MNTPRRHALALAAALASAFAAPPTAPPAPHAHGPASSGVVGLDVAARGRVVDVLVAEKRDGAVTLAHVRSTDGGRSWTAPRPVAAAGRVATPRRGNDPQITSAGERLVAVWSAPGTSRWGGGLLATALSDDGGRTWRDGPNPADDGSTASHGFADLAADERGALHLVWLDSRDGAQGLRASVSRDRGQTWERNVTVDERTCECCLNRLLAAPGRPVRVIYRDQGPRDMAVAETRDGAAWTRAGTAGAFGWQFEGCPETAGALAATRDALHVLVWTGAEGQAGLHVLRSRDEGRTWDDWRRLGGPTAQHGDLAVSASRLATVWDEVTASGRVVQGSTSDDGGRTWSATQRLSSPDASASHPLLAATEPGRFVALWTEARASGPPSWRSVTM